MLSLMNGIVLPGRAVALPHAVAELATLSFVVVCRRLLLAFPRRIVWGDVLDSR